MQLAVRLIYIEPSSLIDKQIIFHLPIIVTSDNSMDRGKSIGQSDTNVLISNVSIPTSPLPLCLLSNNNTNSGNMFTVAMRRALADSINLQGIPLRSTNLNGRETSSSYYRMIHRNIKDRFNLKVVPVLSDGNCLFRTLSHIIFGNESEHNSVRLSLINTFEHSNYVVAFCGIQGYNEITIQQHFSDMKSNFTWGDCE